MLADSIPTTMTVTLGETKMIIEKGSFAYGSIFLLRIRLLYLYEEMISEINIIEDNGLSLRNSNFGHDDLCFTSN